MEECLPWQCVCVIALAKLHATDDSFMGSVGADCVHVVLHLHDLQTLSSTRKPLLAVTYLWGILRQPRILLHSKGIIASGVCMYVSI